MGAMNSCFIPRHSHDEPEDKSSRGSKFKGHRRNLSATFNLSAVDDSSEVHSFVNINAASEEELMTLPGIGRTIARNIVDYRRQISGFRRVEDLALVSGVGAEKLERIRCDICIGSKMTECRDSSIHDSHAPDGERIPKDKNGRAVSHQTPVVNVNFANMFQLMKIKGLGMQLAENIVTYREKNGPFEALDDLAKVKGISYGILSAIRPYLSLDSASHIPYSSTSPCSPHPAQLSNGEIPTVASTNVPLLNMEIPSAASTTVPLHNIEIPTVASKAMAVHNGQIPTTVPLQLASITVPLPSGALSLSDYQRRSIASMENRLLALGPLAEVAKRPHISEPFNFCYKKQSVVRIASWNLEQCSLDKVSNPGVKDVICMTILENGFGIIAVQELSNDKAAEEICQELNEPTLPNVKQWGGHRGTWKCAVSQVASTMSQAVEYSGFLYDTSQNIELWSASVFEMGEDSAERSFSRLPYSGFFKVNGHVDCVVVSVHLKAAVLEGEDLHSMTTEAASVSDFLNAVASHIPAKKDIIVVGDCHLEPDCHGWRELKHEGYVSMLEEDCTTNLSSNNPGGTKCYHNIWLSEQASKLHTGRKGVVREGLSSPWIPNGWRWGGVASDYCPVYTELYTSPDPGNREHSLGADNIRFIIGADSG